MKFPKKLSDLVGASVSTFEQPPLLAEYGRQFPHRQKQFFEISSIDAAFARQNFSLLN